LIRLARVQLADDAAPVTWCWCGPGARDAAALAVMRAALAEGRAGDHVVHEEPDYFLARALATRALLRGDYRCNLRDGAMLHPLLRRREARRSMTAAAACLAAGLALCAVNLGWRGAARAREAALDRDFAALARETAGYPIGAAKGVLALELVRRACEQERQRLEPFERFFAPPLRDTITAVLAAADTCGLRFATASFRAQAITLSGSAPDWTHCRDFLRALEAAGLRGETTRRDEQPDGSLLFTINLRDAQGGAS
jgi:hypothetical protein